jgi:Uma2 family endonuclease
MTLVPSLTRFETDKAGQILYPVDNGEPLANDTEHLRWITLVKNGLDDWFADRGIDNVFIAADLLWYPIEGRPDINRAPDVMVTLNHPPGPRSSYRAWDEQGRSPDVVFEFLSKSNTAAEMLEKHEFYAENGCQEYYIYDYQRGHFRAYRRCEGDRGLPKVDSQVGGSWHSPLLDVTFGLNEEGRLWVRRGDGALVESQREIAIRAQRESERAIAALQRAEALEALLRQHGINPG